LLLSSSIPSPLITALPFIFLTNELHVIPLATLQNGQPTGIQIAKHFFNPHIEEIKQEFDDVKAMGSATAEEWIKGLEGRGRERRNYAVRWERWEASGGVARMHHIGTNGIQNPRGNLAPIRYQQLHSPRHQQQMDTFRCIKATMVSSTQTLFNLLKRPNYLCLLIRPLVSVNLNSSCYKYHSTSTLIVKHN